MKYTLFGIGLLLAIALSLVVYFTIPPQLQFNDTDLVTGYDENGKVNLKWKDIKTRFEARRWSSVYKSPNDEIPLAPFAVYNINDITLQTFDEKWTTSSSTWYLYFGHLKWISVQ